MYLFVAVHIRGIELAKQNCKKVGLVVVIRGRLGQGIFNFIGAECGRRNNNRLPTLLELAGGFYSKKT